MKRSKTIITFVVILLTAAATAFAQNGGTGGIKGKVRVKGQGPTGDVAVVVRQHDREVAHAVTNHKGEFQVAGLAPGIYGLTFRKPGLSMGALEDVKVKAGKVNELPDRLILTVNEASLAKLSGSVFNDGGFSIPAIRVELARVESDGTAKKLDGRLTNESGQFVFRLSPDKATYRITIKADGVEAQTKEVEIDGAQVYRVAFTIQRPPK
jgi:hypothetical protein